MRHRSFECGIDLDLALILAHATHLKMKVIRIPSSGWWRWCWPRSVTRSRHQHRGRAGSLNSPPRYLNDASVYSLHLLFRISFSVNLVNNCEQVFLLKVMNYLFRSLFPFSRPRQCKCLFSATPISDLERSPLWLN
jgi:hypothetical protein